MKNGSRLVFHFFIGKEGKEKEEEEKVRGRRKGKAAGLAKEEETGR